ncbi:hypothetical protein [Streptomyces sp. NPDC023838]|uniref:hypothetical protein n=1 Tax=Streptomyces sp. NPDC023838 TaxID=3154325 RepID=UPI00340BA0CC
MGGVRGGGILRRRREPVTIQVIDGVEPEPRIDSVRRGARLMGHPDARRGRSALPRQPIGPLPLRAARSVSAVRDRRRE